MPKSIHTDKYARFRELLIAIRSNSSLTQTQLAERLGKPQSFVSKYESGERRLDFIEVLELAECLNFDVGNLADVIENADGINLLRDWQISSKQISSLINQNPSLRGMLLGYIAELKLKELISVLPDISYTYKFDDHDRKKKGDLYIIYKGKAFDVESKSLQTNTIKFDEATKGWTAKVQVDASDRRNVRLSSGKILNTTLLLRGEFDILAVNCFGFGGEWKFLFAKNTDLPSSTFKKYEESDRQELIASLVSVSLPVKPPFYESLKDLLNSMIDEGLGAMPDESLFNKN
ncbi:MAG: helix-turn-helix transcriptional regulator [Acidobacteria bacterium]|jgi:transcriptional regulator with XRE-family HTH domain|nr:helix-turn-helix transcriptional regulator [Acidobacteriota bacterium]